jgi:hypothetical protein
MYRKKFGTKIITNANVKRVKMVSKVSQGSFMQKYSSNNIMMNMPEYNRKNLFVFLAGERYQNMVSDIISGRDSKMIVNSPSKKKPADTYLQKDFKVIKPNMYFFDVENPNQVITRKIKNDKSNLSSVGYSRNFKKMNMMKSYGTKWFIDPKKWNKVTIDEIKYVLLLL